MLPVTLIVDILIGFAILPLPSTVTLAGPDSEPLLPHPATATVSATAANAITIARRRLLRPIGTSITPSSIIPPPSGPIGARSMSMPA